MYYPRELDNVLPCQTSDAMKMFLTIFAKMSVIDN